MKESAQAALSFTRSRGKALLLEDDFFQKHEIHVHVPSGAIPKDGPSAGLAMAVALYSLLANRPVRSDLAMTGEITLRGRVLPIGGLKEKVLAALRAGIGTVILPKQNEKDLSEVPAHMRRRLRLVCVSRIDEALELALLPAQGVPRPEQAAASGPGV